MARVKIKHPKPTSEIRLLLMSILSSFNVYATRILPAYEGFTAITRTEEDIDRIFGKEVQDELSKNNFGPVLPPEQRSKRTVLIFNIDDHIFQNTEDEIKKEMKNKNEWMQEGIDNLTKFNNKNIIKIQFSQASLAKKATEKGILAYNMCLPEYNIKQEEYIQIKTCMRCYEINTHFSSECPKDRKYTICSECGSTEHTWRQCKEPNKNCINCKGNHRTLAYKCPLRKQMREEKIKEQKEPKISYSQAAATPIGGALFAEATKNPISRDIHAKIFTIMLHAHFMNIANPGSYQEHLNKTLEANNLPTIIIPECPPSQEIIANTVQTQNTEERTRKISTSEEEEETEKTTSKKTKNTKTKHSGETVQKEIPELEKIEGRELGLEVMVSKSTGWPKESFSLRELTRGMLEGTYKWTYSSKRHTDEEIYKLISNNEVKMEGCWKVVDDQSFRKIRNGYKEEKTPPPSKLRNRIDSR